MTVRDKAGAKCESNEKRMWHVDIDSRRVDEPTGIADNCTVPSWQDLNDDDYDDDDADEK